MPRRILPLLVLLGTMQFFSTVLAHGATPKMGRAELRSAQKALRMGKYSMALKKADQAIQLLLSEYQTPKSLIAEACLVKGNAYLKQEKYEQSRVAFSKVKKILFSIPNKKTLLHAQFYNDVGHYFFALNQIQEARDNYVKSYLIRKEKFGSKSREVASSQNNIGNCFYAEKKYPEALQAYQEAINLLKKASPHPHVELAAFYNNLANVNSVLGDFGTALVNYKKCLLIRTKVLPPTHVEIFNCMRNIGELFLEANEIDSAKVYIKLAMDGYQKNNFGNKPKIADAQMDMSNIFLAKGILDSALAFNQLALKYNQSQLGYGDYKVGRSLRQTGQILFEMERAAKALVCFQEAENIFEAYSGIEDEMANLQDDLGHTYTYLGLWEKSLNAYFFSLQLRQGVYPAQHPHLAGSFINLGLYCQNRKDYWTAIDYFQKAETILKNKHLNNSNTLITLYNNIGNCYILQKDYAQALNNYEKAGAYILRTGLKQKKADYYRNKGQALSHLGQFEMANNLFMRSLEALHYDRFKKNEFMLDPTGVVYSLWFMARSIKMQYSQSKNIHLLEQAEDIYNEAISIIEGIESSFVDGKDKLKLSENFKSILEEFLEIEFMRYELDQQKVHLRSAFAVIENNKNIFLNDIWQKKIHSSDTWRSVSQEIAQLEKALILEEDKMELSIQQINTIERRLLQKKASLDSIQKTLMLTNPQKNVSYFPALHQAMKREQAGLVSYFAGEKWFFAFYVGSTTINGIQIERKKINSLVDQFVSSITAYPFQNLPGQAFADSNYTESAVSLYRTIWLPLFEGLPRVPGRVFISPDGILGFLPFEALLKYRPRSSERQRYRRYPFLILDCEMSYVFSTLPFLDKPHGPEQDFTNPKCLKFAPTFEHHPNGLAELNHNQEEVRAISKIVGGKTLVGAKANLESFVKWAPQYDIIHLATHGASSGRNGAMSFLAFTASQDSIDNEYLYLIDLKGYQLKADLVVLSACESGIGEFQYGEGLISISRGFALANAKSVISTMWSINDEKTVGLMTSFYQHLKKGKTRSKALQQAKIDFLHTCTHDEAHPFFWSSFVPYGEMTPLFFQHKGIKNLNFYLLVLLGIILIALGVKVTVTRFGRKKQLDL